MFIFNQYKEDIVKYDLINKFHYKNTLKIPKLTSIILNFNLNKWDTKSLILLLSSLKLITLQNPKITTSKISNVVFKIRKGQPIGCKLTLRSMQMNKFLFKILNKLVPKFKIHKTNIKTSMFSFTLKNVLLFNELEQNYQFFKTMPNLTVHVKFTECSFKELICLLKSYKLLV